MELTLELSGPEVRSLNTQCLIYRKILVAGILVAKTLIKYNNNNLEENDEEEKEPINIELTEQKQIL